MEHEEEIESVLPPLGVLPYLTAGVAGIGGAIKQRAEDFVVTELPAYEPSGEGTHTYLWIEKTGIDTRTAIARLGQALGRLHRDFGYAGMKDRQAVARQMISIEHVDLARVAALDIPNIKVLSVSRHGNKLRLGHLRGNRFDIRIRGEAFDRLADARAIVAELVRRGLPNYFGPQRFGVRGTGHLLGLALLRGDDQEFLDVLLGRPDESIDYGPMLRARKLYEEGKFNQARAAWPGNHRDERAALGALAHNQSTRKARYAVDRHLRKFFISALQSYLFNQVMVRRLATIDTLQAGDLAFIHDRGAVFAVEDPAAEQPRADRLEVSPSGPLYGYRMTWPTGEQEAIEREVVRQGGIDVEWFGRGEHHVRGERRPLRIPLADAAADAGQDEFGSFIQIAFSLPAGAYATIVLRELMKSDRAETEGPAFVEEE